MPYRLVAAFIEKNAFEHQNFFATAMHMPGKAGARQVAHDAGGPRDFAADAVQHAALDAGQWRRQPFGVSRMQDDALREVVIQILSSELHHKILGFTPELRGPFIFTLGGRTKTCPTSGPSQVNNTA